jgi:radical SAM superfamily enzyme YgiQ (UPF0313 family)
MTHDACKVLLVYPKFDSNSFWNYRGTCELVGAKHPASPLGLITVASLLPKHWEVRLVDRNTAELEEADIQWADMVMTGGMLPQQLDCLHIIELCHRHGRPAVVGGPDATSSPHIYEIADFRVLGEAEDILTSFIEAWRRGERSGTFEAPKFQVDVAKSPLPRFDLLTFKDYFHIGIQFSRGCPFKCEFCDIIELYGRVPRTKTADQILGELDELYRLGYRGYVDFVDDNLIGNKKALKLFLPKLIAWQKQHGYPFQLSTEASLNLADDDELLVMLREAMFFVVFIGIESPDPDVLVGMQKKQNTRRDIADSVRRIYREGIFVVGGFIVGFDEEPVGMVEPYHALIEESSIPVCMVGLLYALPNTQLTRRLEAEGRLHPEHDKSDAIGDQCVTGLNFDTTRPRAQVLTDYLEIIERTYAPENYFSRVRQVGKWLDMSKRASAFSPSHMWADVKLATKFMWNLHRRHPALIPHFWRTVVGAIIRNPRAAMPIGMMMALYAHLGPYSQYVSGQIRQQIADVESGAWQPPKRHEVEPEKVRVAS